MGLLENKALYRNLELLKKNVFREERALGYDMYKRIGSE